MSRAFTQTIRITRRCAYFRKRELLCFLAGVTLTSCCVLFLYPLLLDNCLECLCEVSTTLPTDSPTIQTLTVHRRTNLYQPDTAIIKSRPLYMITSTCNSPNQRTNLIQLCHTLTLVQSLTWIIVEDSTDYSPMIIDLLKDCPVHSVHLKEPTPANVPDNSRGVCQWNAGLRWIRRNATSGAGVIYFGLDDNVYDVRLFEETRLTSVVSVWPIAVIGSSYHQGPVCTDGRVIGWGRDTVKWDNNNKLCLHTTAFSLSVSLVMANPSCYFDIRSKSDAIGNDFLAKMNVSMDQLECRGNNNTTVYVWLGPRQV